jgi:hypothetical protein
MSGSGSECFQKSDPDPDPVENRPDPQQLFQLPKSYRTFPENKINSYAGCLLSAIKKAYSTCGQIFAGLNESVSGLFSPSADNSLPLVIFLN